MPIPTPIGRSMNSNQFDYVYLCASSGSLEEITLSVATDGVTVVERRVGPQRPPAWASLYDATVVRADEHRRAIVAAAFVDSLLVLEWTVGSTTARSREIAFESPISSLAVLPSDRGGVLLVSERGRVDAWDVESLLEPMVPTRRFSISSAARSLAGAPLMNTVVALDATTAHLLNTTTGQTKQIELGEAEWRSALPTTTGQLLLAEANRVHLASVSGSRAVIEVSEPTPSIEGGLYSVKAQTGFFYGDAIVLARHASAQGGLTLETLGVESRIVDAESVGDEIHALDVMGRVIVFSARDNRLTRQLEIGLTLSGSPTAFSAGDIDDDETIDYSIAFASTRRVLTFRSTMMYAPSSGFLDLDRLYPPQAPPLAEEPVRISDIALFEMTSSTPGLAVTLSGPGTAASDAWQSRTLLFDILQNGDLDIAEHIGLPGSADAVQVITSGMDRREGLFVLDGARGVVEATARLCDE